MSQRFLEMGAPRFALCIRFTDAMMQEKKTLLKISMSTTVHESGAVSAPAVTAATPKGFERLFSHSLTQLVTGKHSQTITCSPSDVTQLG